MASSRRVKKHECTCGRSFRHAISLKRHQNVTGCDGAEIEPVANPTPKTSAQGAIAAEPSSPPNDSTLVITPALVASWQEQTGFQRRPKSIIDSIATQPAKPKTDWKALGQTGREFADFCVNILDAGISATKTAAVMATRMTTFLSVVLLAGWMLVSGVSASDASAVDEGARNQMAAQNVVEDFLLNAKLNHYHRAYELLAPAARQTVSSEQLQMMINSLPLEQTPHGWATELSNDGQSAWVTLARGGVQEVYTLVQDSGGWGLSSVAIANS